MIFLKGLNETNLWCHERCRNRSQPHYERVGQLSACHVWKWWARRGSNPGPTD